MHNNAQQCPPSNLFIFHGHYAEQSVIVKNDSAKYFIFSKKPNMSVVFQNAIYISNMLLWNIIIPESYKNCSSGQLNIRLVTRKTNIYVLNNAFEFCAFIAMKIYFNYFEMKSGSYTEHFSFSPNSNHYQSRAQQAFT